MKQLLYQTRSPTASTKTANPTPATFAAPPVNKGTCVVVLVAPLGGAAIDVEFLPEGLTEGTGTLLEGEAVATDLGVLVTWIREVDAKTGGPEIEGRAGMLDGRKSEMVKE